MGENFKSTQLWSSLNQKQLELSPHLPALIRPSGELQFGVDPKSARIVRLQSLSVHPSSILQALRNPASKVAAEGIEKEDLLQQALQAIGLSANDALELIDELAAARVLVPVDSRPTGSFLVLGSGSFAVQVAGRLRAREYSVQTRAIQRRTCRWLASASNAEISNIETVIIAGQLWPDGQLQQALHQRAIPHFPVGIRDGSAVIGPLVEPGKTACLSCMDAARIGADKQWPVLRVQLAGLPTPASGPAAEMALALTSAELDRWPRTILRNREVTFMPTDLALQHRRVRRHPLCPVCAKSAVC